MAEQEYSIYLNHLTVWERVRFPETFPEYAKAVVALLTLKDAYLFEEDILKQHEDDSLVKNFAKDGKSKLEAILETTPDLRSAGKRPNKKKNNELEQAWFNLAHRDLPITPDDFLFDLFFTYKLRQTDILKIDKILDYFLGKYYEDDKEEFSRFLKLLLRKDGGKLLDNAHAETISEWIAKEKVQPLSGTETIKAKWKVKRDRDDGLTKLNQEQTALLIYLLQEGKIILKDEFLNNKDAGQAFAILTGFSGDSLRQNLGKAEIQRISTKKNMTVVANTLTNIQLLIDRKLKDIK